MTPIAAPLNLKIIDHFQRNRQTVTWETAISASECACFEIDFPWEIAKSKVYHYVKMNHKKLLTYFLAEYDFTAPLNKTYTIKIAEGSRFSHSAFQKILKKPCLVLENKLIRTEKEELTLTLAKEILNTSVPLSFKDHLFLFLKLLWQKIKKFFLLITEKLGITQKSERTKLSEKDIQNDLIYSFQGTIKSLELMPKASFQETPYTENLEPLSCFPDDPEIDSLYQHIQLFSLKLVDILLNKEKKELIKKSVDGLFAFIVEALPKEKLEEELTEYLKKETPHLKQDVIEQVLEICLEKPLFSKHIPSLKEILDLAQKNTHYRQNIHKEHFLNAIHLLNEFEAIYSNQKGDQEPKEVQETFKKAQFFLIEKFVTESEYAHFFTDPQDKDAKKNYAHTLFSLLQSGTDKEELIKKIEQLIRYTSLTISRNLGMHLCTLIQKLPFDKLLDSLGSILSQHLEHSLIINHFMVDSENQTSELIIQKCKELFNQPEEGPAIDQLEPLAFETLKDYHQSLVDLGIHILFPGETPFEHLIDFFKNNLQKTLAVSLDPLLNKIFSQISKESYQTFKMTLIGALLKVYLERFIKNDKNLSDMETFIQEYIHHFSNPTTLKTIITKTALPSLQELFLKLIISSEFFQNRATYAPPLSVVLAEQQDLSQITAQLKEALEPLLNEVDFEEAHFDLTDSIESYLKNDLIPQIDPPFQNYKKGSDAYLLDEKEDEKWVENLLDKMFKESPPHDPVETITTLAHDLIFKAGEFKCPLKSYYVLYYFIRRLLAEGGSLINDKTLLIEGLKKGLDALLLNLQQEADEKNNLISFQEEKKEEEKEEIIQPSLKPSIDLEQAFEKEIEQTSKLIYSFAYQKACTKNCGFAVKWIKQDIKTPLTKALNVLFFKPTILNIDNITSEVDEADDPKIRVFTGEAIVQAFNKALLLRILNTVTTNLNQVAISSQVADINT